jgi:replicative DNA helicase
MSEIEDPLIGLFSEIEEESGKKQKILSELNNKKLDIEIYRTEQKYKQMTDAKDLQEDVSNLDFELNDPEYIDGLIKSNTQYLNAVRTKSMTFLNSDFRGVVPYMPNQLVIVGARTGRGKSTTCANLIYQAIMKSKKTLTLSNEEKAPDVFNRVTSLIKGVAYTEHDRLTDEQVTELNEYIKILGQRMLVIDDDQTKKVGGMGIIEMVQGYINKAIESKQYDAIIIDYYQKINQSADNPMLGVYEVQAKFADYIGDVLKHPDCPAIVLMAQLKPDDKEGRPIEERIEGRKAIAKPATCILEAAPDYDRRCTTFTVHKSRWSENNGKGVDVGYMRGKYVKYDLEFKEYVEKAKMEETKQRALRNIKPKNTLKGD